MGSGSWNACSFSDYAKSSGRKVTTDVFGREMLSADYGVQDLYKAVGISPELDPRGVVRECRDTSEHPQTVPVILALDVTGSMGSAASEVAKKLNIIMTELYNKVKDVEFLVMGIGDLAYDKAPVQASQFESDIRIAEQLDKVYFEGGGGGNAYESYTAAWYFGLHHTDLDCWKRGKKGIIITLGDEPLNPFLNQQKTNSVFGDLLQADAETLTLYEEASKKFDIYHIAINDKHCAYRFYANSITSTWSDLFGNEADKRLIISTLDELPGKITDIIVNSVGGESAVVETMAEPIISGGVKTNESGEITW